MARGPVMVNILVSKRCTGVRGVLKSANETVGGLCKTDVKEAVVE